MGNEYQTRNERLHYVLETTGSSTQQASPKQNGRDTKETQAMHLQLNKETLELPRAKINRTRDAMTMKDMFHLKGTLQQ
jgi:hypothetical protein